MSLIPEISEDESFEKIKNGFKINFNSNERWRFR